MTKFFGVLLARVGDSQWMNFVELSSDDNVKNNPYYLWTHSGKLLLSIINTDGAGSGEGIMKLLSFGEDGVWKSAGCYYFGHSYSNPDLDGDYYAYSSMLSKQKPSDECERINFVKSPN